jgi:parallel beta-helix repeat protein
LKPANLIVLVTSALLIASFSRMSSLATEPQVIRVPEDFPRIQQAIDEASPGDVVQVASGTYFENLQIKKPLKLIGEGPDRTVISKSGTVVSVNASDVEIRGFSVRDGTYGIFLYYCKDVLLRDNDMSDNTWNFGVWGSSVSHFVHDIDSSNMVDGKPMCYLVNENGGYVSKDAGYVALINCTKVTAEDLSLTSNEQGVLLVNTKESIIKNVTMSGNDVGIDLRMAWNNTVTMNSLIAINWLSIYLTSSNNNTFTENTIREGDYGISTRNSNGNTIYHNNFIENKVQQYRVNSSNTWDDGGEGNYWSDYNGTDLDGDGVGDTLVPHLEVDYYPLMSVYDTLPPIADAGEDQKVFENASVDFNASGSTDNAGIASYFWDFGDGSVGAGVTTKHAYAVAGNYTVTLTVKDEAGNSATHAITVVVVETPEPLDWRMVIAGVGVGAAAIVATILWMRKSIRRGKGDKS